VITGKDSSNRYFLTSLTRISDFADGQFEVRATDLAAWSHGDYVAARVVGKPSSLYQIEIPNGRMVNMMAGDRIIGAFGKREATLEVVGDWEAIGDDGRLEALTAAGLLGKTTSMSVMVPRLMALEYEGHVHVGGVPRRMHDYAPPVEEANFNAPVVLMVGTSMSAGKTTAGRVIVHELNQMGRRVVGAKFTGAARFRDTLSYGDAGAAAMVDFVDAGLPSTVVTEDRFREAMNYMLARIAAETPEVVVAEAGASPLEPYNGDICIEALRDHIAFVVLCAWDPYSVVGVQKAFGLRPDIITGPTTNTTAGVRLVEKLTGLPALNLMNPESLPRLRELLRVALP
jgi:hypothetical protein